MNRTELDFKSWIEIEIVNHDKYNPRLDRKKHSWFRLQNNITTEKKLYGLSAGQRFFFIALLAEASSEGKSIISILPEYFADLLKMKEKEIVEALQHFINSGVIRLPSGNQLTPIGVPTDGRTDDPPLPPKGNGVDNLEQRFISFWTQYPRKVGKAAARKKFMRLKPTQELLEQMIAAIVAQKQTEQWKKDGGQFIPHPATWLSQGRWEDQVDNPGRSIHPANRKGIKSEDYEFIEENGVTVAKLRS